MGTPGRRRTQHYALKDAKQAIRYLKIPLAAAQMECNQDVIRKSPPVVVHGSPADTTGHRQVPASRLTSVAPVGRCMGPSPRATLAINDAGAARHNWAAPRKGGPFVCSCRLDRGGRRRGGST